MMGRRSTKHNRAENDSSGEQKIVEFFDLVDSDDDDDDDEEERK